MSTQPSKIKLELNEIKFASNKLTVSQPSVGIIANQLYQKVLDGNASAIDTYEGLKFIGDVADELKKCTDELGKNDFTELVRQEIQERLEGGREVTTKLGSKFALAEVGTKYDFTASGDPIWNYYTAEITKLDKLKKTRETFLKTITDVVIMTFPDPITGELLENVELLPPIKTSTSSFKVTLLKD